MRWGRLSLILVITGGIVGANFAFKNLLVKRLIESALQSIFQAKAQVNGVQFSLTKGRLKWDTLTVANKDKPMFNLFELGFTEFDLHTGEMLKRKVVIENLECQGIQWDTPREKSGALPHLKKKKEEGGTNSQPSLMEMAEVNAEELLEKHKSALKSIEFLSNANRELEDLNNKWSNQVVATRQKVSDLDTSFKAVQTIDAQAIQTVPQATAALKKISDFQNDLSAAQKLVQTVKNDSGKDLKQIKETIKRSKAVVQEDLAYLKSQISIPEGGAKGVVKMMLHQVIADLLGKTYYYGMQALEYTRTLDDSSPKNKKKQKQMMKAASVRRPGWEVHFPGTGYPDFLIQHLGTSITNKAGEEYLLVDIKDISSDVNLWNKPLKFLVHQSIKGEGLSVKGLIDTRTNTGGAFAMDLMLSGRPFAIGNELQFINITNMKGVYNLETGLAISHSGDNEGHMKLVLTDVSLDKGAQTGTINDILYDILTDSSTIDIFIKFQMIQPDNRLEFTVSSSIDKAVEKRIGRLINDMVAQATRKLGLELGQWTGPLLKENNMLGAQSLDLEQSLLESDKDLVGYQQGADQKKTDVTKKLTQIKTGNVTDKIPQGVKLPGF